jgi:hypothetical protein
MRLPTPHRRFALTLAFLSLTSLAAAEPTGAAEPVGAAERTGAKGPESAAEEPAEAAAEAVAETPASGAIEPPGATAEAVAETPLEAAPAGGKAPASAPASAETPVQDRHAPKAGKLYFIPGPSFGVNPVYGVMLGVGATASYYFGDPKTTRASNILFNFSVTTTGQLINTYRSFVYTKDDDWILIGDWRYLNAAEPTFGLGTGPSSAKLVTSGQDFVYDDNIYRGPDSASQLLTFEQLRFYETVFKRIYPSTYLGLGYHLDVHADIHDNLLDLENDIVTSHYAYSKLMGFDPTQAFTSGISLNALYDSRDSPIGTRSGLYGLVSFRVNAATLGSSKDSSTLALEYRQFFDLSPKASGRDVFAIWAYGNFTTSGALPYLDLPATSYDQFGKSGRGYVQGRFRGEHFVYTELEYRRKLFDLGPIPVRGVVFLNFQTAGVSQDGVKLFEYIEPAGGGGLRFTLQKPTRLSIAIDYGVGNYDSSAFYIRMNDTF